MSRWRELKIDQTPQERFWGALRRDFRTSRVAEAAIVLSLYSLLTILLLWPLFARPSTTVIAARHLLMAPDIFFIIYVLSWGWHALTSKPLDLFNANIFHPATMTLAGSEHMLGHIPIFGTTYALSGNPVLAHQVNLFASFTLSGAALYALLRHWGASPWGGLFGGFVYAFCPVRLLNIEHSHLLAGQYLPLALLFFDRLLDKPSKASATLFGLCVLMQGLCSYYLLYISFVTLGVYASAVLLKRRLRFPARSGVMLLVVVMIVGGAFYALSRPYLRWRAAGWVPEYRETGWIRIASAGPWKNFLYPPRLYREKGYQLDQGIPLYVGVVPLALAVGVLLPRSLGGGWNWRWARCGAGAVALGSYVMTLGPEVTIAGVTLVTPYKLAMEFVPGFSSMRQPSRFGLALMLGVGALAGLGADRLLRGVRRGSWDGSVTIRGVGLGLLVTATAWEFDALSVRIPVREVATGASVPAVYRVLSTLAPGPVLEIPPGWPPEALDRMVVESEYTYFSIYHWFPLLNGYSGYRPQSYVRIMALAQALPDSEALELLHRMTGLRYVLVHLGRLGPWERGRWQTPEGLRELRRFEGGDVLFELEGKQADLMGQVLARQRREETVLGTPLRVLPERARRSSVRFTVPPPGRVGVHRLPVRFEVEVANESEHTWPALVLSEERHAVSLVVRWEGPFGEAVRREVRSVPLPYDLRPGKAVRVLLDVLPPERAGRWRLVVGVAQDGAWFSGTASQIVEVVQVR